MYVDAILDRKTDTIHIVERIAGQRVLRQVPASYVFYYEDPHGTHQSIYGHLCQRSATARGQQFQAQLRKRRASHRIFESDVNPVFRVLAEQYMGAEAPTLNLGFFDIEVAFDPVRSFAAPDDPFNPITAISVYRTADAKLLSFLLRPPTLAQAAAQAIVAAVDDSVLFDDEKSLLLAFLDAIEDVDCLTGWNCLPVTEPVWLQDRIKPLGEVLPGMVTASHGDVVRKHMSGNKRANRVVLDNGYEIFASDEHRIPVYIKDVDGYMCPTTLLATRVDQRVDEIKVLLASDKYVYMELQLRNNLNVPYTYRKFIEEYWDHLMTLPDFGLLITSAELRDKVKNVLTARGLFDEWFPYSRKFTSYQDYPQTWCSRRFDFITSDDLRQQVQESETIKIMLSGTDPFVVGLDDPIPCDVMQVLGLQFTDGSYYRKGKSFTLYSTDIGSLAAYRDIVRLHSSTTSRAVHGLYLANDDCGSFDYRRGSVFGLLAPMIYDASWSKRLNREMLSRLSYAQFCAFFSGFIDGDGCLSNGVTLCNFDDNLPVIQELLLWNGVYASLSKNVLRVPTNAKNEVFLQNLSLRHWNRADKLSQLTYFPNCLSSNKLLRKFILDDRVLVRVRAIEETATITPMADIETVGSYFHCRGVMVHNSAAYDVPYLVNRIQRIVDIRTQRRLSLWDYPPTPRQYKNKFGKLVNTYDFVGRVHLDYLDLYAKHNQQQRLSYRLDAIGEIEVGENKIPYEGTLDDLYNKDFDKFIRYNRQDVMLMVKIDDKLKFIQLANQIAHSNCVLLKTTMGSVALVEQAIINGMHAAGRIVPDRPARDEPADRDDDQDDEPDDDDEVGAEDAHVTVVGAYVAQPKTGLQDHVGCVDLKSLYPSAIRALNMSPETLVAQVRLDETMALVHERIAKLSKTQRAEAWDGLFCTCEVQHMHDQDAATLTVDFFDHLTDTVTTRRMTGRELHDYVFDDTNQVCITANGTIYSTATEGMIPALLAKWYAEREVMQSKKKQYERQGDVELAAYWDRNQLAGKIRLNMTYGAILNAACRFNDDRLGQSTTLTGRSIDRHMIAQINEAITGIYDHRGESIVYADTDSCYFSAYQVLKDKPEFQHTDWSRENIIQLYDAIAEQVNQTFPAFMQRTFHTTLERGGIIRAGRELVASRGLFIKKKKYAVLMYDKEGKRLDVNGKPGELKPMGLDLKRADTPKVMQQFLETLLMDVLTDVPQAAMFESIRAFRQTFKDRPGWEKGSPKKVANLAEFAGKLAAAEQKGLALGRKVRRDESLKVSMPGHVRASLNWNRLCEVYDDRYATRITDSNRIIVCKLRNNTMGMTSIAYPMDERHLPLWFRELPFDDEAMEETIIDNKILNLCGVLNWDLADTRIKAGESLFQWS